MQNLKKLPLLILFCFISTLVFSQNKYGLTSTVHGIGEPIILIPGLTSSGSVWHETISSMSGNYQYHVIELPGFAGNKPMDDHEGKYLEKIRDGIIQYIQKNNIKKPAIIGHSLGGFLALTIAIEEPNLLSKLVIVDALPFLPAIRDSSLTEESATENATHYRAGMMRQATRPDDEKRAGQKEFLKWMITSSSNIDIATEWYMASDNETIAQAMYEMNTTDIRDDLEKINVPALVLGSWIAGKEYGATREGALRSYKLQYANLENLQIDMSDKGKHFIMWDDPDFFIGWLKKFL